MTISKNSKIILGLICLTVLFGQSYFIYDLQQKLDRISNSGPFPQGADEFFSQGSANFFNDEAWNADIDFKRIQDQINRVFNRSVSQLPKNAAMIPIKTLNMNLKETDKEFIVTLTIPGGKPESYQAVLDDDTLNVTVQSEQSENNNSQSSQSKAQLSEVFSNSIVLPKPVKQNAMMTRYKDGVLTITIPKIQNISMFSPSAYAVKI